LDDDSRQAAQLNVILKEHGYTDAAITWWWKQVRYAELGNRTATNAWLTGKPEDREAVNRLVATVTVEDRRWAATMREAAKNGTLKDRIAAQLEPRAIVGRWQAGQSPS